MAISTAASGCRRLVPSAQGIRGERGTAARVESWRPAPHSPAAYATAVKDTAQCLVSEVLGKVLTESRGPSQQPAAQRVRAHSTAGVAGRAPTPASPGRDAGPGCPGQVAEHDPAMPAARIQCYLKGRSLQGHHYTVVEHLAVLSIKTEPREKLERSCLARTEYSLAQVRKAILQRQQDSPEESELQQQEGEQQRFSLTRSEWLDVRPSQVSAKDRMGRHGRDRDRGMSLLLPGASRCAAELQPHHLPHPCPSSRCWQVPGRHLLVGARLPLQIPLSPFGSAR